MRMNKSLPLIAALVLAALAGDALAQEIESVNISLTSYAFAPNMVSLKVGTKYRLHFSPIAKPKITILAHQKFFAAAQIDAKDQAEISGGAIDIGAGQAVDVTVTPVQAGRYDFICSHFMHKSFGMRGMISVQ